LEDRIGAKTWDAVEIEEVKFLFFRERRPDLGWDVEDDSKEEKMTRCCREEVKAMWGRIRSSRLEAKEKGYL
jgi:hypothetical protein